MAMTMKKLAALAAKGGNYPLALSIAKGEATAKEVAYGRRLAAKGVKASEALKFALRKAEGVASAPKPVRRTAARSAARTTATAAEQRILANEEARRAYYAEVSSALGLAVEDVFRASTDEIVGYFVDEDSSDDEVEQATAHVKSVRAAAWAAHSVPVSA